MNTSEITAAVILGSATVIAAIIGRLSFGRHHGDDDATSGVNRQSKSVEPPTNEPKLVESKLAEPSPVSTNADELAQLQMKLLYGKKTGTQTRILKPDED